MASTVVKMAIKTVCETEISFAEVQVGVRQATSEKKDLKKKHFTKNWYRHICVSLKKYTSSFRQ